MAKWWAVYRKQRYDAMWHLAFLLPPTLTDAQVEDTVRAFDGIEDKGYRHYYLTIKDEEENIKAVLDEYQHPYSG